MESILTDVSLVLENWLEELSTKEIQLQKITDLQQKIDQRCRQYELEGNGIIDIGRLRFVSQLWKDILGLIYLPDKRNEFTYKILQLFEAGEISIVFANEIINK